MEDKNYKEILHQITTFIFDVDGVLTDGTVTIMPDGEQVRKMLVKDGYALQLAVKKGYNVAIISGGRNEGVRKRLHGLGIKDVFLGISHKIEQYEDYINDYNLKPENILYMGDDLPDYEVMQKVGLATCPADAASEIKSIAKYVSHKNGGEGCVRDVMEQVMKLHGKWMDQSDLNW